MNLSLALSDRRPGWLVRHLSVLILVLAVLAVPTTARAQDVDLEALDTWIESLMEDWSTPGLAVGIGTQIGGGCTSGHGVCGIGRLSKRSTVATISFMITAALTVLVVNEVVGGAV